MSFRFAFDRATPVTATILTAYAALLIVSTNGQLMNSDRDKLVHLGAALGILIADGEPWRLVTSTFLHGGLIHAFFNASALVSLGPQLERLLGSWRFLWLYLVTGVGGAIVGMLWHSPLTPLVGGSGALFGMLGAMVALNTRHGKSPLDFLEYEGPRQLLVTIFANFVLGFVFPFVSNAAHFGGLVTGFVLVHQFSEKKGRHAADRLGRVIQTGWIALYLTLLLWCAFPVTRWDALEARLERDPAPELRIELEKAYALTRR